MTKTLTEYTKNLYSRVRNMRKRKNSQYIEEKYKDLLRKEDKLEDTKNSKELFSVITHYKK